MTLLKQETTKKRPMDKKIKEINFHTGNSLGKEYKLDAISDSAIYAKKLAGHLPVLYYLIFCKDYLNKNNI